MRKRKASKKGGVAGSMPAHRGTVFADNRTTHIDRAGMISATATVPPSAQADATFVTMSASSDLAHERVLTAGAGISIVDGGANSTVTISASPTAAVADATYLTLTNNATLTNERVLTAGTGIAFVDTGANGTLTVNATGGYTDEQAQDAVGTILADSADIDFTYTDATPEITAVLTTTGVVAGTYENPGHLIVDSKGRITTIADGRRDGLIPNHPNNAQTIVSGWAACVHPVSGVVYFTSSAANGALYSIDRVSDRAVLVVGYAAKNTTNIIYDPVSTRFYIAYGTTTMSVTPSTGAIVTAGIARSGANGFALCTNNGLIYCGEGATVGRIDPSTDTSAGSTSLAGNQLVSGSTSIAYATSSNTIYTLNSFGEVYPIPCSTNVLGSQIVNTTGGGIGSIIYCSSTDRIYVTHNAGTHEIVIINPNTNTVASTVSYPAGFTTGGGTAGQEMHEFGDYIYIGTQQSYILIFHKATASFIGYLTNFNNLQSRGIMMAGVVSENVLYTGIASADISSALLTYRGTV